MIVEFAGLPGSGKTTLSGAVKAELLKHSNSKKDITIDEPSALIAGKRSIQRIYIKLCYAILGSIRHPLISLKILLIIFYSHQNSIDGFFKNYFNGLYLIGLYNRYRNSSQIVLFDQGGLQALWSVLFSSTIDFEEKQKLITRMPGFLIAEYIVFPDCGTDLILSRLEKREGKQSRIEEKSFSDEKVLQLKDDLELLRLESIKKIDRNEKKMVLVMDNSDEIMLLANSKIIAEKLIEEL